MVDLKNRLLCQNCSRYYSKYKVINMNEDAIQMSRYMNRPETYQSGRIYSFGVVNLIREEEYHV